MNHDKTKRDHDIPEDLGLFFPPFIKNCLDEKDEIVHGNGRPVTNMEGNVTHDRL